MGYLLIPLLAGGVSGPPSIAFYLTTYFATTILAFGVISVLSSALITHHLSRITHHEWIWTNWTTTAASPTIARSSPLIRLAQSAMQRLAF